MKHPDHSRFWFAAPLVAIFAIMLAISLAGHGDAGATPPRAPARWQPDQVELQALRDASTLGNRQASVALAGALLDAYERDGDREQLHEALHWIDRHWDSPEYRASGVLSRVFDRDCDDALARSYWLCNGSE